MLVADVLSEARSYHESFSPDLHPDLVLLEELARAQEQFYREVAKVAENALALDTNFDRGDIADAIRGDPLTLPDYLMLLNSPTCGLKNGAVTRAAIVTDPFSGNGTRLWVRVTGKTVRLTYPEDFQQGVTRSLRQAQRANSPWVDVLTMQLTYVPLPERPEAMDDELEAPDQARIYLSAAVASFAATRMPMDAQERAGVLARAEGAKKVVIGLYESIGNQNADWHVRRVV